RPVSRLLVQLAVALHTLHVRLLDELRGRRINVSIGHSWILSKCNYSPARTLACSACFRTKLNAPMGGIPVCSSLLLCQIASDSFGHCSNRPTGLYSGWTESGRIRRAAGSAARG